MQKSSGFSPRQETRTGYANNIRLVIVDALFLILYVQGGIPLNDQIKKWLMRAAVTLISNPNAKQEIIKQILFQLSS